ncbi:hypothetical protein ACEZDB_13630 [Streptacidiphilus sp. N1-3]|uniref:Lipoprotein n=1 Tax=Streptacidiphilus alkalitolerans TaxID=3342712 RepID=A0ABV6X0C6_9ACTN
MALTACSGKGPVNGTLAFTTVRGAAGAVTNPEGGTCHSFGPAEVASVDNGTLADLLMFQGPDCANPDGSPGIYVPTETAAQAVLKVGAWRSFRTYV